MKYLLTLALSLAISFTGSAQVIINEVLYDPSNTALEGDANGDGVYDQTQDEFIELVNIGPSSMDISKYKVWDVDLANGLRTLRHTMSPNRTIPAGGAMVIFGGGTAVGTFGGAIVVVDAGTQGLSLNNTGEAVIVTDSNGVRVDSLDTDALSNNPDESYTRNPDLTGAFVQHHLARAGVLFSPGLKVDGTPFATAMAVRASVEGKRLSVFPNPSDGTLQIDYSIEQGEVEVVDILGHRVARATLGTRSLDLKGLPNGTYWVRQINAAKGIGTRLVLNR